MRHTRTTKPDTQTRVDGRTEPHSNLADYAPPWAAGASNENGRARAASQRDQHGGWDDETTTLYRPSTLGIHGLPRTPTAGPMTDEPRLAIEGSLVRSMPPDTTRRWGNLWPACLGALALGACIYFSVHALVESAPLPYVRSVPSSTTEVTGAATPSAAAQLAMPAEPAVDEAPDTAPPSATPSITGALPSSRTGDKPRQVREGLARRIEPLRDPVNHDEPLVSVAQQNEGVLQVNSRPWARVLIDGRFVGHTPQLGLRVPAGRHHVRLVNEQMDMSKVFDVAIKSGETVRRVVLLDDNP